MAEPVILPPITPPPRWWTLPSFGYCTLIIFTIALIASIYIQGDIRTMMFQATISITTGAVLYWFQSSAGSAKKEDTSAATTANTINALANSTPSAPSGDDATLADARATIAAHPVPAP